MIAKQALLSINQMYQADYETSQNGVSSWQLMKNAGKQIGKLSLKILRKNKNKRILILCGPGNNGGDGYIAAKYLQENNIKVDVFSFKKPKELKGDAKKAFDLWDNIVYNKLHKKKMSRYSLIIDSLFGAGISRPLNLKLQKIASWCEELSLNVLSVDMPSGINGDTGMPIGQTVFKANHTITFFRAKTGHKLFPGKEFCGQLHISQIGIKSKQLKNINVNVYNNEANLWKKMIPRRRWNKNKYDYGHAVIFSGEMTGATKLASLSCLRAGAGLVTIMSPKKYEMAYRLFNPSLMILSSKFESENTKNFLSDKRINALAYGFGSVPSVETKKQTLEILKLNKPTVLDAGSLTSFSSKPEILYKSCHTKTILTPHSGEFERIFPQLRNITKLKSCQKASQLTNSVIVLKGADTIIAEPSGNTIICSEPFSPWLATAGTGDVLSGLIASMLAQGLDCFHAAAAGVWIHNSAGKKIGPGLISNDLVKKLKQIIQKLHN